MGTASPVIVAAVPGAVVPGAVRVAATVSSAAKLAAVVLTQGDSGFSNSASQLCVTIQRGTGLLEFWIQLQRSLVRGYRSCRVTPSILQLT